MDVQLQITPWFTAETASAVLSESETMVDKLQGAVAASANPDLSPEAGEACYSHRATVIDSMQVLEEGFTEDSFASTHYGVKPCQLSPPIEPEEAHCSVYGTVQVYWMHKENGAIWERKRGPARTNIHCTTHLGGNESLYSEQAADTTAHYNRQQCPVGSLPVRTRGHIEEQVRQIAMARGLLGNSMAPFKMVAKTNPPPRDSAVPTTPVSAVSAFAGGTSDEARRPPMFSAAPAVPPFPGTAGPETAVTRALPSFDVASNSSAAVPVGAVAAQPSQDLGVAQGEGGLMHALAAGSGLAERHAPPSPSTDAIHSPPHTKLRTDYGYSAAEEVKAKAAPTVVNLSDVKGMSAALSSLQPLQPAPRRCHVSDEDAMSVSSSTMQFPGTSKHERPLLRYPVHPAIEGFECGSALVSLRRALTLAKGDGSDYAKQIEDRINMVTSAIQVNLPQMVQYEVSTTLMHLRKLRPLYPQAPARTYCHLAFRYALEEMPPKKNVISAEALDRIFPSHPGVEPCNYDERNPRLHCSYFSATDLQSGIVPSTVRMGFANFVYGGLIAGGC